MEETWQDEKDYRKKRSLLALIGVGLIGEI